MNRETVQKKSKGHRCYLCGQRFPTIHQVRRHVNIHKEKDLQCSTCGKYFSSKWGLSKHMAMHAGARPYKCGYCERTFRQKGTLTNHIAKIHENNMPYSTCRTCGKNIKGNSQEGQCWLCWYRGYSIEPSETVGSVEVSEIVTIDSNAEVTNGENHNCQGCGKPLSANENSRCMSCLSFGKSTALEHEIAIAMISSASSSNVLEPKHVDINFPFVDILSDVVENPKNPCCSQCRMDFPNLIALREHNTEVHKPHWQFSCPVCSATFATSDAQKRHVVIHKENRPFSCLVCNRSFKCQMGLKNHLQTHRADRPYKCKVCDQAFKTAISLKAHAVVHQKERPYACRECGFAFKTVFLLKRHTIVHSGELPYRCDTCGKRFRYPGNLGRHNLLHTSQGSYACQVCGKTFTQTANLKQHEQIHNKNFLAEKTLQCPLCGKAYKSVAQLRKHLTIHRTRMTT